MKCDITNKCGCNPSLDMAQGYLASFTNTLDYETVELPK